VTGERANVTPAMSVTAELLDNCVRLLLLHWHPPLPPPQPPPPFAPHSAIPSGRADRPPAPAIFMPRVRIAPSPPTSALPLANPRTPLPLEQFTLQHHNTKSPLKTRAAQHPSSPPFSAPPSPPLSSASQRRVTTAAAACPLLRTASRWSGAPHEHLRKYNQSAVASAKL
jgi:hypothetical protein